MTAALTPKQLDILRFVVDFRMRKGRGPTYDETADVFGICKAGVYEHLEQLVLKGYLTSVPNQARSLRLANGATVPGDSIRRGRVRLMGTVKDGDVHWR